jgi:hypothetical protein
MIKNAFFMANNSVVTPNYEIGSPTWNDYGSQNVVGVSQLSQWKINAPYYYGTAILSVGKSLNVVSGGLLKLGFTTGSWSTDSIDITAIVTIGSTQVIDYTTFEYLDDGLFSAVLEYTTLPSDAGINNVYIYIYVESIDFAELGNLEVDLLQIPIV